ncbi:hypothetical protein [Bacillus sp. V5-8f]|uniref:hypothetical protein n=1 Tax=Bacillus sp. V5-8f TaxID=2053044 RepID=UPI000C77D757|nr:hypothetical protein [Bacillus sp. V5-8f]PLT31981.1 hypothetical protein CUU64_20560 [Bacillus sp. V5-8f]
MDAVAAKCAAAAKQNNFINIMRKRSTATKISELFKIRKEGPLHEGMAGRIADVKLINHVVNHPALEGNRPKIYINRFLLSIFIEIMTTIANESLLRRTALLLRRNPEGVRFEKLQVQIWLIVEGSLNRQKTGNELTKITHASIAYHILEANQ